MSTDKAQATATTYGFLWKNQSCAAPIKRWHFNDMQDSIPEPIVRGKIGLEIGSGCGYDTFIMAEKNPGVKIFSFDLSDGIFINREITSGLNNVWLLRASALRMPIKNDLFDFAYSYGVLHHTPNPEEGIQEAYRVIKKDAPFFTYLYEDHRDSPIKYLFLQVVNALRKVTTRIPSSWLYFFCYLASPLVVILFSFPARVMRSFKSFKGAADVMPFNFGTHLFSLAADLYDRLAAPIEHRFSRDQLVNLFVKNGFANVSITKIKSRAGWVIWGYKVKC